MMIVSTGGREGEGGGPGRKLQCLPLQFLGRKNCIKWGISWWWSWRWNRHTAITNGQQFHFIASGYLKKNKNVAFCQMNLNSKKPLEPKSTTTGPN